MIYVYIYKRWHRDGCFHKWIQAWLGGWTYTEHFIRTAYGAFDGTTLSIAFIEIVFLFK